MEYEYKTILVSRYRLMETFDLGMWIIPDDPPTGFIPPTPDEIKQMYFEKIEVYLPYDPVKRLTMLAPEAVSDGWETVFPERDVTFEGFQIRNTRQPGPMGWTTNFGPQSLEVRVRRLKK